MMLIIGILLVLVVSAVVYIYVTTQLKKSSKEYSVEVRLMFSYEYSVGYSNYIQFECRGKNYTFQPIRYEIVVSDLEQKIKSDPTISPQESEKLIQKLDEYFRNYGDEYVIPPYEYTIHREDNKVTLILKVRGFCKGTFVCFISFPYDCWVLVSQPSTTPDDTEQLSEPEPTEKEEPYYIQYNETILKKLLDILST